MSWPGTFNEPVKLIRTWRWMKETACEFGVERPIGSGNWVAITGYPAGFFEDWCEKNCVGEWRVLSARLYLKHDDDVVLAKMTFA